MHFEILSKMYISKEWLHNDYYINHFNDVLNMLLSWHVICIENGGKITVCTMVEYWDSCHCVIWEKDNLTLKQDSCKMCESTNSRKSILYCCKQSIRQLLSIDAASLSGLGMF